MMYFSDFILYNSTLPLWCFGKEWKLSWVKYGQDHSSNLDKNFLSVLTMLPSFDFYNAEHREIGWLNVIIFISEARISFDFYVFFALQHHLKQYKRVHLQPEKRYSRCFLQLCKCFMRIFLIKVFYGFKGKDGPLFDMHKSCMKFPLEIKSYAERKSSQYR